MLFNTTTPVSEVEYKSGDTFRVNQPSGASKGAIINCKSSYASQITGGDPTNTCYLVGIKNNKITAIVNVTNNSVSLRDYDYIIVVPNGGKNFTFN